MMLLLRRVVVLLVLAALLAPAVAGAQNRFPQPDFESGYSLPQTAVPSARSLNLAYLDVVMLVAALSLASWLALKGRSRRGMAMLSVFSLLYFGFWRKGCVCPVGATQNILLGLFDGGYGVPLTVLAFFVIPVVFTLFFGRTFCAAVCPLGALQDVVVLRPLQLPPALRNALGTLPHIYLAVVVLFVATGAGFMICRYEPFVPLYRLSGSSGMLWTGAAFLVAGIWIARPYCRFLCPYGLLLNWTSRFSRAHAVITPAECVDCRLCENSCPFGAIRKPTTQDGDGPLPTARKRLALLILALPPLIILGGWLGARMERPLSLVHPKVRLAEEIFQPVGGSGEDPSLRAEVFRQSEVPASVLYSEAEELKGRFGRGGMLLGSFLGLVFGSRLIGFSLRRQRSGYEPDRGECLSCGRCFTSCPVDHVHRHGHPGEFTELLERLGKERGRAET